MDFDLRKSLVNMLLAAWEVRTVKIGDLGLENAARPVGPSKTKTPSLVPGQSSPGTRASTVGQRMPITKTCNEEDRLKPTTPRNSID